MEDINFKKFICYILNCIGATEDNEINILYINNELKKVQYNNVNKKSKFNFKKLAYAYNDIAAARAAASDAVIAADGADGAAGVAGINDIDIAIDDIPYIILKDDTSNIKQYLP